MRHRFINDGQSPIPLGRDAKYTCVCGKTGTREAIEHHVAERQAAERAAASRQADTWRALMSPVMPTDDFSGGSTKADYLPVPPRQPALSTFGKTHTPPELPPPPTSLPNLCLVCQAGDPVADLPEIAAWSCGHWIRKEPRPIAEAFQNMLRGAFHAGVAAAASGETFEGWYQREVLR